MHVCNSECKTIFSRMKRWLVATEIWLFRRKSKNHGQSYVNNEEASFTENGNKKKIKKIFVGLQAERFLKGSVSFLFDFGSGTARFLYLPDKTLGM